MAIIRTGPIVGAISGTIGSVVFVAGGKSTVVRPRPTTLHKTSTFLARSRVRMQQLQNHWSTLTALQQDLWRTAAREIQSTNSLGQGSPMNGFQYFIKTNKVAFPGAFATIDAPSTLDDNNFPVNPFVDFSVSGGLEVRVDNPGAPSPLLMQIYGWPTWVDHEPKFVRPLVFIDERAPTTDPVVDFVDPEWRAHFGNVIEGQRISVGFKTRGSASPFAPLVIVRSVVTA